MFDEEKVRARLLKYIESKGSKAAMERKSGVTVNTIYCWRAKKTLPQLGTFLTLVRATKPTVEELLWLLDYEDGGDKRD